MAPQDVRRADEPVLVSSVNLHRICALRLKLQNIRAQQGHVVIVHHIIGPAVEDALNGGALQEGLGGLLREQRG